MLKNLTVTGGNASGTNEAANGAAILLKCSGPDCNNKATLSADTVTFSNNTSTLTSFSGSGLNAYHAAAG